MIDLEPGKFSESEDSITSLLVEMLIEVVLADGDEEVFDLPREDHVLEYFFKFF